MVERLELAHKLVRAAEDVRVERVGEQQVLVGVLGLVGGLEDLLELPAVACVISIEILKKA